MRCPKRVRTDRGSENGLIATLQCILSNNLNGHVYGSSPQNQRIESFWSLLKRLRLQWWINLFQDLVNADMLDTSKDKHIECVRYCFMELIQSDLDRFKSFWNSHRIRQSVGAVCPGGIPEELYFINQPNTMQCMIPVDPNEVVQYRTYVKAPSVCANSTFATYLQYVHSISGISKPSVWQEAVFLYIHFMSTALYQAAILQTYSLCNIAV